MNQPIILIVGRPNVGKSTLFNRLVGKAAAVVFDRPGVTRDLLEADLAVRGETVRVMDSAGWPYPGDDPRLSAAINRTVERALKKSTMILWVVDGTAGRTGAEDLFAERLRPYRNKTVLVINKLDELERPETRWADSEFAGLPWNESFALSAKHGRGIADLLDRFESKLAAHTDSAARDEPVGESPSDELRLTILGRPNVGKSTLVNFILKQDRMVVSDKPGTTRDAVESRFRFDSRTIRIVDTAGVRRIDRIEDGLERTISRIALQSGQSADLTIVLMDISHGLVEQDLRLLTFLWRRGVSTIAAANKWDLVPDRSADDAGSLEKAFRKKAHEASEVPFILISAKTGHGIPRLIQMAERIHATAHRAIRTSELNRHLQSWSTELPTGLFRGKAGKLKYAVQTGKAPIRFKIFVNDPDTFRPQAMRYLIRRFRDSLDLRQVPVLLELVASS